MRSSLTKPWYFTLMSDFKYAGSELELFAAAHNWKSYWSQQIRPLLSGDILEVGAGIGSNTLILDPSGMGRWLCLEPDPDLIARLVKTLEKARSGRVYESVCGTLRSLKEEQFDVIIYVDVLEHVEDDRDELNRAASHLRPRGHLIVISPAHQCLFTPFDAAIGHFRRYNRAMLRQISPGCLSLVQLRYLDSFGLIASTANLLLRQSMPTRAQIRFWDRWIVPVSRALDPCFRYSVGKSILAVWCKA
jgi:2-polyprenyl-3-methyl-5-hydroxy-6-metoxy-1,4-benzoquinol methylase